jgi:serine/threonine protein kinase
MGVVYKARDPKINRIVALKTISLAGLPEAEQRDFRARFSREAEAAGRLSHPGIVTIFDADEDSETQTPFIVMEFVGGQTLDQLLARSDQKLPLETALQITLELADALDCAHAQGVVHRDVKPSNILITEDGHAKIADFGVAKLNLANQTLAGRALGTPAYMSPEQVNGEAVDGRSDIFSLGVILYTMVTGHRPFQGNSAITVSFKVVNRDFIPATILNAELPDGLDQIVARAMAKDPADRYQRGSEMQVALRNLIEARERASKTVAAIPLRREPEGVVANAISRSSVFAQAAAPTRPVARRPLTLHDPVASNLLKQIRSKSYIGVSVLAGLFILGLSIISFGPQGMRPRAAEQLPTLPVVQPKIAATESNSSADSTPSVDETTAKLPAVAKHKASVPQHSTPKLAAASRNTLVETHSASPKDLPKPVPAARIYPALATVAQPISGSNALVNSTVAAPTLVPANLAIEVDHPFTQAHLSIWVDDQLTYTHVLEGTAHKRLIVFHHVEGHELHSMQLSPGKHVLRVRVTSDAPVAAPADTEQKAAAPSTYDGSATLAGDFSSARENVLHVSFKKHGEMSLTLQ